MKTIPKISLFEPRDALELHFGVAEVDAPEAPPERPEIAPLGIPEVPVRAPETIGDPPPTSVPLTPHDPRQQPVRADTSAFVGRSGELRNLASLAEHQALVRAERRSALGAQSAYRNQAAANRGIRRG